MAQNIPWARVLVEGAVIVVSVLLALAGDAWWDGRQERLQERQVLLGLSADFEYNLSAIGLTVSQHEVQEVMITKVLSMPDSALVGLSDMQLGLAASAILNGLTFDSRDGTLDALIASGALGIIRDPILRDLLVEWKASVEDLQEENAEVRAAANGAIQRAAQLGGPWRVYWGDVDARSRHPFMPAEIALGDEELVGLVRRKSFVVAGYLGELGLLIAQAERVLDALLAQLPETPAVDSLDLVLADGRVSLGLDIPNGVVELGTVAYVVVVEHRSDGSTIPFSLGAEWSSSEPTIVDVTDLGVFEAVAPGESNVCAVFRGESDCLTITVVP